LEGIFLWAFEGLKRLAANQFRFTESTRAKGNREIVRQDANNLIQFMESEGYVMFRKGLSTSSQELYRIYQIWCEENALPALKPRSVSDFLIANQKKYSIEYTNNATNSAGRRVRGFKNIKAVLRLPMETKDGWQKAWPDDNPFEKT
jgi:putative DNA primase/helicase